MLTSLALIFLSALLLGGLFQKLRLPGLLGMLITGIVLGTLGLIDGSILGISAQLRQIALIIILMRAGLSLHLRDLKKVGRPAILMCFVPACFEIAAVLLFAPPLLGITLPEAAVMGSVLAAVSPAVIVPRMLRLMETGYGTEKSIPQPIMAGASVDDVSSSYCSRRSLRMRRAGKFRGCSLQAFRFRLCWGCWPEACVEARFHGSSKKCTCATPSR